MEGVMRDNYFNRLSCFDMVEDNEKIWFYDNEKNILCEFDRTTEVVSILLELEIITNNSYTSIQKINQKLVLTPGCADYIVVYEMDTKLVHKIYLDNVKNDDFYEIYKFWDSYVFQDYVYMLGFTYPAIIKLDTRTMSIEYLTDWIPFIKNRMKEKEYGYLYQGKVIGEAAWISCGWTNAMLKLNLLNDQFEYYVIPAQIFGCGAFSYDGKCFWIGEWYKRFEKILCWKPGENRIKVIEVKENTNNGPFRSIMDIGNKLLLFPYANTPIYQIEKESGIVTISDLNQYCSIKEQWKIKALRQGDKNVKFVTGDSRWHEYDFESKTHVQYDIPLNNMKILMKFFSDRVERNCVIYEEKNRLDFYLKYILNKEEK